LDSSCFRSLRTDNGEALVTRLGADAATSVAAYCAADADVGAAGDADLAGYVDWVRCDEGECEEGEVGQWEEADGCHDCFLFGDDVADVVQPAGLYWKVLNVVVGARVG